MYAPDENEVRDARLTAYALDEMNEDERAAFERDVLAHDTGALRGEIEALRDLGARLRDEFRHDAAPAPTLDATRRQALDAAAATPPPPPHDGASSTAPTPLPAVETVTMTRLAPWPRRRGWGRRLVAAAACLAVTTAATMFFMSNGPSKARSLFSASTGHRSESPATENAVPSENPILIDIDDIWTTDTGGHSVKGEDMTSSLPPPAEAPRFAGNGGIEEAHERITAKNAREITLRDERGAEQAARAPSGQATGGPSVVPVTRLREQLKKEVPADFEPLGEVLPSPPPLPATTPPAPGRAATALDIDGRDGGRMAGAPSLSAPAPSASVPTSLGGGPAPVPVRPRASVDRKSRPFRGGGVGGGGVKADDRLVLLDQVRALPGDFQKRELGDHRRIDELRDAATDYDLAPAAPPAVISPSMDDYNPVVENPFLDTVGNPLSTFAFDVDTASWPLIRHHLRQNQRPPPSAVRIEEMVNYFPYHYPPPTDPARPFAVHVETGPCPWQPAHRLLRIGIKGKTFDADRRPACHLTFLVDVSGSMSGPHRLGRVVDGLTHMVKQLDGRDRVSLVTYANGVNVVLDSVGGDRRGDILDALRRLSASGGTNGEGGIQKAYEIARRNFVKGAANRVILCTDGDFNIGITDRGALGEYLEKESRDGIFLSALGFGMGNHKDAMLEWLANKGHGFHSYVDDEAEARRVFGEQMLGTVITIAKDVKVQVEFNPARVGRYRLIGYEHRLLAKEDFNNDKKDGGDIGAGHTATALYEWVPPGVEFVGAPPAVDPLRYAPPAATMVEAPNGHELLTVKIRHKTPEGQQSVLHEYPVKDNADNAPPSAEFNFAAGVAAYGLWLRNSPHQGNVNLPLILRLTEPAAAEDPSNVRKEFVALVRRSETLNR